MSSNKSRSDRYNCIYKMVQQIPYGHVATYGKIASLCNMSGQARLVGYALHALPEGMDIPWHRVINAKGMISQLPDPDSGNLQRRLLESEGIVFNKDDRIDLEKYSIS